MDMTVSDAMKLIISGGTVVPLGPPFPASPASPASPAKRDVQLNANAPS